MLVVDCCWGIRGGSEYKGLTLNTQLLAYWKVLTIPLFKQILQDLLG